jgi:hypothetical protein
MRHRSKTNSRPAENRAVRRQYMASHPLCELHVWFTGHFSDGYAHDPHHICSTGGRWDLVSNLLAVSRRAHTWIEENKTDGRVLAIWIKLEKQEFNAAEFNRCSGMFVQGWLVKGRCRFDWAEEIRLKLIEHFGKTVQ